ncbi:hypothetical protein CONCODRAFT_80220 [Conidiobolus coronatus NRRL 28638]|uniref:PHD-type domain-containing protein n=1 Tax=Conidiobolus coronatus (strain ATCC 28846 / CBS 209.66 / NRRL 28638) TaxID=796925 RepID=A0A137NX14_CONC2|nr:hypothetical protein CONCODRAFT_80220 [Conidiobolus coronatus NRRL 28638]|eukprot:KXN67296.1 hypothetical protein CONCODRAFT_80220 [Conidiobolus coronatus NRRL 28638]
MPTQVSISQPHRGLFTRSSSYYSTMYGGSAGFGPPSYSDDSDSALEDMTEVSESESEPEIDSESISQISETQNKVASKPKTKSKPKPKATQKPSNSVNFLAEDCMYDTDEEDEYIIRSMTENLLSKAQHINPALIAPIPSSPRPSRNIKKPNYNNPPTGSETDDDTSSISTNQIDPKLLDLLTSEDESSIPDDLDVIELKYDLDPELLSPTNSQSDLDLDPRRRIEIPIKKKISKPVSKKNSEKPQMTAPKTQTVDDSLKSASSNIALKPSLSKYSCMICDGACTDNDTNHLSCKICNLHFHKSCINVQSEISDYTCRPCRKEQKEKSKPKQVKKFKRSSLARRPESQNDSQSEPSSKSSSPSVPKIKIKSKSVPVPQVSSLDFSDTSSDSDSSLPTQTISIKSKSKQFKVKYPLCPPSSPEQLQPKAGKRPCKSNISTANSEPSQSRAGKRPGKTNLSSICRPESPVSPQPRAGKRPMKANLSSLYNQPSTSAPRPVKRSVKTMRSESPSPVIQVENVSTLFSDSDEEIQLPPKRKTVSRSPSPKKHTQPRNLPTISFSDSEDEIQLPPKRKTLSRPPSPKKSMQSRKLPAISFSDSEDDIVIPKQKSSTRPPSPIKHNRHSKSLTRPSSPITTKHNHTHSLHSKSKSIRKSEKPKAMKKPRTHHPIPSASHPTKFSSANFKSQPLPRPSKPVIASQTLKLTKPKPTPPSSSSSIIADEEDDIIIIDSEEEDLDCCPICVGICTC